MKDKYRGKYRNKSIRLQNWDYSWNAAYFVTICTHQRRCFFGEVVSGKMKLSPVGIIADILWHEIKNHAQNVELGAYVVMPNHIHGILILNGNNNVGTTHALSLLQQQTIGQQRFQNQGKNTLSSIVGSYKSAVTRHARRLGFDFAWQPRFYEHIIRNEKSFENISNYIINNPEKWGNDRMFTKN